MRILANQIEDCDCQSMIWLLLEILTGPVYCPAIIFVAFCSATGILVSLLYPFMSGSETRGVDAAIARALASFVALTLYLVDQQTLCSEPFGERMAEPHLSVMRTTRRSPAQG